MDKDLTGKKFGKLTVIRFDCRKGTRYYWLCKCKCRTIRRVERSNLTSGHTKSCGCLHKEIARIRGLLNYGKNKDITGQRFGMLIALESTYEDLDISEEDERQIQELAADPELFNKLRDSIHFIP